MPSGKGVLILLMMPIPNAVRQRRLLLLLMIADEKGSGGLLTAAVAVSLVLLCNADWIPACYTHAACLTVL